MSTKPPIAYDRRVSQQLLEAVKIGGPLHGIVELALADRRHLDVQLRSAPGASSSHASLYFGLTTLLDVHVTAQGRFRLRAHETHRKAAGFVEKWSTPRSLEEVLSDWDAVLTYARNAQRTANLRHIAKEGKVHAAMCSGRPTGYRVIDREASPKFRDDTTKKSECELLEEPIYETVRLMPDEGPWWDSLRASRKPLGTGLDVLATDDQGRLLVIEAKPAGASAGIAWAPAQVRFYAELFARWWHSIPEPAEVLDGMLWQRATLGLGDVAEVPWPDPPEIVPVVAIGAGKPSQIALHRLRVLNDVLSEATCVGDAIGPLQVWQLDEDGNPTQLALR